MGMDHVENQKSLSVMAVLARLSFPLVPPQRNMPSCDFISMSVSIPQFIPSGVSCPLQHRVTTRLPPNFLGFRRSCTRREFGTHCHTSDTLLEPATYIEAWGNMRGRRFDCINPPPVKISAHTLHIASRMSVPL
jgi:hypothetical protein